MKQSVFIAKGVFISSIAAGPVFATSLGLTALYASLPKAIAIESSIFNVESLGAILGVGLLVLLFGFILAILPNALGGGVMATLGLRSDLARLPAIWVATGIALTAIPVALLGGLESEEAPLSVALIITGGLCALIVRRHTKWVAYADEPATPAPASVSPQAQSALGHRNTGARLLD